MRLRLQGHCIRATVLAVVLLAIGCREEPQSSEIAPARPRAVEPGERFFTNLRQLTFEGQNAEAYFSADGTRLIFQRQRGDGGCDQQYVMNIDGSGMRRVSNGLGRTTCGFYYQNDERILYSSTFHETDACPPPPDRSQGYVWPLSNFDIYSALPDGSDLRRLTSNSLYDAEATLSPDGETIVFTSTRDGDLDIYTMNADGTGVKRLTNTLGYDGGPFFSPDGSMIVQSRPGYQPGFFLPKIRPRGNVFLRHGSYRSLNSKGHHRVAYTEFGESDNPRVLICVHGLTRNGRDFDTLAAALAGDYRVAAPITWRWWT